MRRIGARPPELRCSGEAESTPAEGDQRESWDVGRRSEEETAGKMTLMGCARAGKTPAREGETKIDQLR